MAASITLSNDLLSVLDGVNLKWVIANFGNVKELTLVYFKNTSDSDLVAVEIASASLKYNLKTLESGINYSFQIQATDSTNLTIYSNTLVLVAPFVLSPPVISSITGFDDAIQVNLATSSNSLTANDSVEFVLKRQSDNMLFWIVKPFTGTKIYNLSSADDAKLSNGNSYRVACMFQPDPASSVYITE